MTLYTFWPEQFVQWVGNELPYSMVQLNVDDNNGKPIFDFVLTDRATQKRAHHSNVQAVVAAAKAQGEEAWLINDIKLDRPDAATTGAIYTVHLTLHDGKPVEWRFIQGSDVTEQGSGLTPLPTVPIPVFAYREQSAVAGEGTAIQIGDTASSAEMWKEISKPPYFVAWHGAYTVNATTLVLPGGEEKWTIASAPSALTTGATWKLTSATGRQETIRAEKVDGTHATLSIEAGPSPTKHAVDATWDGSAWHFEQLRYTPRAGDKHGLAIQFAPALSNDGTSNIDILVGKKKIVNAAATTDATKQLTINFKSPDWTKSKSLTEALTTTSTETTLKASPR